MNAKEGKTNKDLFLLMLQRDVKNFVEKSIEIPQEFQKEYSRVTVDFYVGSGGNIGLDSVNIQMVNKFTAINMFSIEMDGSYRNNHLSNQDFDMVIGLVDTMKLAWNYNDGLKPAVFYDLFALPSKKSIEEQLKEAVESENYELASILEKKLNKN